MNFDPSLKTFTFREVNQKVENVPIIMSHNIVKTKP